MAGDCRATTPSGLPPFEVFLASPAGQQLCERLRIITSGARTDDIAQDTLLWAWLRWPSFHDADHVGRACRRYARRRLIDHTRRGPGRFERPGTLTDDALGMAASPETLLLRLEERRARWQAFHQLPQADRALLLAVAEADGKAALAETYAELARAFDIPAGTLRVRIHRVRRTLRRLAEESNPAGLLALPAALAGQLRKTAAALTRPTAGLSPLIASLATLALSPFVLILPTPLPAVATPIRAQARPADRPPIPPSVSPPGGPGAVISGGAGAGGSAPGESVADPEPGPICLVVCVRPDDDEDDDDGTTPAGEELCVKAAKQCVAQEEVGGACPYLAAVPEDAASCRHYSETKHTLPPPPGGGAQPPPTPPPSTPHGGPS